MKRIIVPAEMLSAVDEKGCSCARCRSERAMAAETILRYISEHPQVPTDEQFVRLSADSIGNPALGSGWFRRLSAEWQRRCFVQEEPEIPEEIRELVPPGQMACGEGLKNLLYEAYRRGLRQKGEQK